MCDPRYCRGSLWHAAIPLGCTQHHLRPETNYLLHDLKKTIRDACHQHSEHIQAASDPLVVLGTPSSATARVWRGGKTLTAAGDDGADGRDSTACGRRGGRCTSERARGKATYHKEAGAHITQARLAAVDIYGLTQSRPRR